MKEEFERYEAETDKREAFVKHLRDVADYTRSAWVAKDGHPLVPRLPVDATTDAVKLCLAFLTSIKHSVTIAPMVRFYSEALGCADAERPQKIRDLEAAMKALTSFSALWRASRRGTANIDQQYRELLAGSNEKTTGLSALARRLRRGAPASSAQPQVSLAGLKAELRARLAHGDIGAISSRDVFIREASAVPAYKNSADVARFILLAAYHDAVAEPGNTGLIMKGKGSVSSCLTYAGFCDERNLSLEHIAPQDQSSSNTGTSKGPV